MKDQNCAYCMEGELVAAFGIKICELETSKVYLFKEQSHPGRVIVAHKKHVSEIVELTPEEGGVTLVQLYAKKIPTISFALFMRISLITDRHNVRLSSWDNLSYKALKSDCNKRSAALKSGAVSCTGSVS